MAFYILIGIGGFLLILGSVNLLLDAFRTHWAWGAAIGVLFSASIYGYEVAAGRDHVILGIGIASLTALSSFIFLCMHWNKGKRGGALQLIAIPLLGAAFFLQPPPATGEASAKSGISDPFARAMNQTRKAIKEIQTSRVETARPPATATPAVMAETKQLSVVSTTDTKTPSPTPTPVLSLQQRLFANREKFKQLAVEFDALASKRSRLPKNDLKNIHAFNDEAAGYAKSLAAARAEQDQLLAMQKGGR